MTGLLTGLFLALVDCSGGGSGGTGGGSGSTGGGSAATGGGGGTGATGGGTGATGGGTGGGTGATGGGSSAAGGGSATTDGGPFYFIQDTQCFDFRTATVGGASCDMQGQGDGSLTTHLPAPAGTNGLGNLCDLNQNGTSHPPSYNSLAEVPASCGAQLWGNYIEGGGASLSKQGILVYGGEPLPDGGPAYYRAWIPNSSPTGYRINFQFAPL